MYNLESSDVFEVIERNLNVQFYRKPKIYIVFPQQSLLSCIFKLLFNFVFGFLSSLNLRNMTVLLFSLINTQ